MSELNRENVSDTSARAGNMQKSSKDYSPSTKDGEEPIELLLELASYDLQELVNRGIMEIHDADDGRGMTMLVFIVHNATWNNGIVLNKRSNGYHGEKEG